MVLEFGGEFIRVGCIKGVLMLFDFLLEFIVDNFEMWNILCNLSFFWVEFGNLFVGFGIFDVV